MSSFDGSLAQMGTQRTTFINRGPQHANDLTMHIFGTPIVDEEGRLTYRYCPPSVVNECDMERISREAETFDLFLRDGPYAYKRRKTEAGIGILQQPNCNPAIVSTAGPLNAPAIGGAPANDVASTLSMAPVSMAKHTQIPIHAPGIRTYSTFYPDSDTFGSVEPNASQRVHSLNPQPWAITHQQRTLQTPVSIQAIPPTLSVSNGVSLQALKTLLESEDSDSGDESKRGGLIKGASKVSTNIPRGLVIGAAELCTFLPNHTLWPVAGLRLMRNGYKGPHVAEMQLYARGNLNSETRSKRSEVMKHQRIVNGKDYFGDPNFTPTSLQYKTLMSTATVDYTTNSWVPRKNLKANLKTIPLVKLARGVVNWPAGQDCGVFTQCVQVAVANGLRDKTMADIPEMMWEHGFQMPAEAKGSDWDQRALKRLQDAIKREGLL